MWKLGLNEAYFATSCQKFKKSLYVFFLGRPTPCICFRLSKALLIFTELLQIPVSLLGKLIVKLSKLIGKVSLSEVAVFPAPLQ